MNTIDEMKALILRHYASINFIPDIDKWKYHEIIWSWREALAHFGMSHHYSSLVAAPDGLKSVWITEGDVINNYEWIKGRYELIQQWTKEFCYDVYGDKIPGSY